MGKNTGKLEDHANGKHVNCGNGSSELPFFGAFVQADALSGRSFPGQDAKTAILNSLLLLVDQVCDRMLEEDRISGWDR